MVSFVDSTFTGLESELHIVPRVLELYPQMIAQRRWFHTHPELSFEEVETAAHVVEILRGIGITEIFEGVGLTGLRIRVRVVGVGIVGRCLVPLTSS